MRFTYHTEDLPLGTPITREFLEKFGKQGFEYDRQFETENKLGTKVLRVVFRGSY